MLAASSLGEVDERGDHRVRPTTQDALYGPIERAALELFARHRRHVDVRVAHLSPTEETLLVESLERRLYRVERDAPTATEVRLDLLGVGASDAPEVIEDRALELAEKMRIDVHGRTVAPMVARCSLTA